MLEKKILEFVTKESFLMKILNDVAYDYEPYMDKKSYQIIRNELKQFIFKHGYKLYCNCFPDFKSYCELQFDKYFEEDDING